jgi:hypothetical protein
MNTGQIRIKHLEEIQKGYFEHLWFAWRNAGALFIHGIFPFWFTTYVSDSLKDEHNEDGETL